MKKCLVLLALLNFSAVVFAQKNGDLNYSVGAVGYTMMQMPKILNDTYADEMINVTFNGILIKFNDNQINYRLKGTVYHGDKNFNNNCNGCQIVTGKVSDYVLKVGFEKNINYGIIQPYFGMDVGFRANVYKGELSNVNSLRVQANERVEATKYGMILAPILGIKINPINELSLFAESAIDFFYSYERQTLVTRDANNGVSLSRYNKAEFLLVPVSVGVQFHFGAYR